MFKKNMLNLSSAPFAFHTPAFVQVPRALRRLKSPTSPITPSGKFRFTLSPLDVVCRPYYCACQERLFRSNTNYLLVATIREKQLRVIRVPTLVADRWFLGSQIKKPSYFQIASMMSIFGIEWSSYRIFR